MVLGVTDQRLRRVVGTLAFAELERTKAGRWFAGPPPAKLTTRGAGE